jgi:hypothetical protein
MTEDTIFPTGPQPIIDTAFQSPLIAATLSQESLDSDDTITLTEDPDMVPSPSDPYTPSTLFDQQSTVSVDRQSSFYSSNRSSITYGSNGPNYPDEYPVESHFRRKDSLRLRSDGSASMQDSSSTLPSDGPHGQNAHPQDHSRLKQAWESMIESRFLTLRATTVLAFYINSTFAHVDTLPILDIPIPNNSILNPGSKSQHGSKSSDSESVETVIMEPEQRLRMRRWETGRVQVPFSAEYDLPIPAQGHLNKAFHTASACKEVLREEYIRLFRDDQPPVKLMTKNSGQKSHARDGRDEALQETFETAWESWRCDMMDRMGTRSYITNVLAWAPQRDSKTAVEVWRKSLENYIKAREEDGYRIIHPNDEEIPSCRTLRGYIAHKPAS